MDKKEEMTTGEKCKMMNRKLQQYHFLNYQGDKIKHLFKNNQLPEILTRDICNEDW